MAKKSKTTTETYKVAAANAVASAPVANGTAVVTPASNTTALQSGQTVTGVPLSTGNGINTTGMESGNTSVKSNSQTGGNGNATINPYSNAYNAYQTSMNKVKESQLGQANTEYNNQQKQIEGAYQNLGRNAYQTYMQRQLQNRQALSNMGANRTGMAENMQTANAVDYNRSIGNTNAYRQAQLSNAENAYNTNVANINNEYDTKMAEKENEYANLGIQRQNELEDLQKQLDFQAKENALDRQLQVSDTQRAYEQQRQALRDSKYEQRFNAFVNTIGRYSSVKSVDKAISDLKKAKKNGTLKGWKKEYYTEMMNYLKAQRTVAKKSKKK